jgi:hypothetical protein
MPLPQLDSQAVWLLVHELRDCRVHLRWVSEMNLLLVGM